MDASSWSVRDGPDRRFDFPPETDDSAWSCRRDRIRPIQRTHGSSRSSASSHSRCCWVAAERVRLPDKVQRCSTSTRNGSPCVAKQRGSERAMRSARAHLRPRRKRWRSAIFRTGGCASIGLVWNACVPTGRFPGSAPGGHYDRQFQPGLSPVSSSHVAPAAGQTTKPRQETVRCVGDDSSWPRGCGEGVALAVMPCCVRLLSD